MSRMRLKDIAIEKNERVDNPSQSQYSIFVGLEHYDSGEASIRRHGSTERLESTMKVFHSGDILIARRNVYLKRAATVDFDGLTSGDSIVLHIENEAYRRIAPFVLNTDDFRIYANQHADGSMSKRLSPKLLMEYEFSLPDENLEQVADILWAMERVKIAYRELIARTDDLVKSQFIEMFGLPAENRHGYEVGRIGDVVCDVHYGTSKKASDDGKYTYLRMNNITFSGELDLTDTKRINVSDKDLAGCAVKRGDVLFNRTNSRDLVGKTCVFDLDEPMVIAGYIIRLRMNGCVLPEYLSTFLNLDSSKKMLYSMAKGAVGQANINAQEVQAIELVIPPREAQLPFKSIVEQSDKSKFAAKQALDNLNASQKALMNQIFGE